jgi:DNA-binding FadR family transcriptional regulator
MAAGSVAGESEGVVVTPSASHPPEPATPEAFLRSYIVEHGLRPGDRLPSESELAADAGCGRMAMREALCALAALGVLEARVGSGWYVKPFEIATVTRVFARSLTFHPRVLLDLLHVRQSIEADSAAVLAGRISPRELAALDDLVVRMRERAQRGERHVEEDGAFHRHLAAVSGNLVAVALVDLHWELKRILSERGIAPAHASNEWADADAHAAIVDALRRGDAPAARNLVHRHHAFGERRYRDWLNAYHTVRVGGEAVEDAIVAALLASERRDAKGDASRADVLRVRDIDCG